MGASPYFEYSNNKTQRDYDRMHENELAERNFLEDNHSRKELGISGACGVEWFFRQSMSLTLEWRSRGLFL